MTTVTFTVLGRPAPGGSKQPFIDRAGRPRVREDAKRGKPWRDSVAAAAVEAMRGREPKSGPLMLDVTFYVARPSTHFGSGRNRERVRPSAPYFPAVRPDVTKLVRALEDALTHIVWRDDAQVVMQIANKRYGTPERAVVTVQGVSAWPPRNGERDVLAEDAAA